MASGRVAEEVAEVEGHGGDFFVGVFRAEGFQHEGVGVGAWGAGVGVVGG